MSNGIILKGIIAIFLLSNLGVAGYNSTLMLDRGEFETDSQSAIREVISIKKAYQQYKDDIRKISTENIISVDTPNGYFAERARIAGFDAMRDLGIPKTSDSKSLGSNFQEEIWKITFAKKRTHTLERIARFCELIEAGSPQFQIKNVDLGKRSEIWGKNEWSPKSIQVRRITRKSKRSSRR